MTFRRTYVTLAVLFVCSCGEPAEEPLLPIPLHLHQSEASILHQLDSAGYKVRDHVPNEQLGDSIPLAGLPGVTTYFFHPDGIWHGIHFAGTDSTFNDFRMLRTRMERTYGNPVELVQHPQNKQGYAVWMPASGEVRVVRLSASRGGGAAVYCGFQRFDRILINFRQLLTSASKCVIFADQPYERVQSRTI